MPYEPKRPLNLPLGDLMDLEFHLMDTRPGVKLESFVTELIQHWLAIEKERQALRENGRALRGFQWKNVFLPDGATLRTTYRQTTEYAKVSGDRIVTDSGESTTPSIFANRHAKGRNAWRFVWLRFPGEEHWTRAEDYRLHQARQASQRAMDRGAARSE